MEKKIKKSPASPYEKMLLLFFAVGQVHSFDWTTSCQSHLVTLPLVSTQGSCLWFQVKCLEKCWKLWANKFGDSSASIINKTKS